MRFGTIGSVLAKGLVHFDQIWSTQMRFGTIGSDLAILNRFGYFLSDLAKLNEVWSILIRFGQLK